MLIFYHQQLRHNKLTNIMYGGPEGPFQTSNFSISISELVISKIVISKSLLKTFILASN